MENKQTAFLLASILMLTLSVSKSFPRDNNDRFFSPILLNGKVLDLEKLSPVSTGKLSFAGGSSNFDRGKRVPFFAYLKRAGKIVNADSYAHNQAVLEIEISEILKSARVGDELVIDPAMKKNGEARHSVNLKQSNVAPQFQWFFTGNKSKGGC